MAARVWPVALLLLGACEGARVASSVRARATTPRAALYAAASAAKRVRFLFSDTGGGHRASALALKGALEGLYPGRVECDLVDVFVESGVPPYSGFPDLYKWLAANPPLWAAVFEAGGSPPGQCLHEISTEIALGRACEELIGASPRPDCVVSVHPLLQGAPLRALARLDGGTRTTPFATVVTDLGSAHPTWFHREVDACFVPSDALRKLAKDAGLRDGQVRARAHRARAAAPAPCEHSRAARRRRAAHAPSPALRGRASPRARLAPQLVQHGLPIRPAFAGGRTGVGERAKVRAALELSPELPTVLVVGGGDGMGGLADVATATGAALARVPGGAQMVVVCGRNEAARAQLEAASWPAGVGVRAVGFVSDMERYMAAADAMVSKAGPGTIAEAAAMGLPTVLSSFLPGQEAGNVDFVEEAGFGVFKSSPAQIGETVAGWLADEAALRAMEVRAQAAARPDATDAIARDLAKLVLKE